MIDIEPRSVMGQTIWYLNGRQTCPTCWLDLVHRHQQLTVCYTCKTLLHYGCLAVSRRCMECASEVDD